MGNKTPKLNPQKELERRILSRAKGKCEYCGLRNKAYEVQDRDITRIKLTVFHLDLRPTNNSDANLVALCQICLAKAQDKAEKARNLSNGKAVQEQLL